jgi:hypothetical protein
MKHDHQLARRLYARPDASAIISRLPDMGNSIHDGAIDLAREQTLEACDKLIARVKTAETSLVHLRKALIVDQELARDLD